RHGLAVRGEAQRVHAAADERLVMPQRSAGLQVVELQLAAEAAGRHPLAARRDRPDVRLRKDGHDCAGVGGHELNHAAAGAAGVPPCLLLYSASSCANDANVASFWLKADSSVLYAASASAVRFARSLASRASHCFSACRRFFSLGSASLGFCLGGSGSLTG